VQRQPSACMSNIISLARWRRHWNPTNRWRRWHSFRHGSLHSRIGIRAYTWDETWSDEEWDTENKAPVVGRRRTRPNTRIISLQGRAGICSSKKIPASLWKLYIYISITDACQQRTGTRDVNYWNRQRRLYMLCTDCLHGNWC